MLLHRELGNESGQILEAQRLATIRFPTAPHHPFM